MTAESMPERKSPDHLIGETLANRYQIEEKLGEGAMGSVYRARHVKVGRAFAVKVLHRTLLDDNKVAQRFEREAELAGRLSHANVIGVVDVGETPDGLRYMVMDFAEGEDLAGLLADAPFSRDRIIRLTRQLLEGLFHAHEAGLIHRDFKPENVIISKDDHDEEVPRIVDFGIAILREGGDSAAGEGRLTTNGLVLGTPHYMAPEQAVADPIDHRIDLFALGIVIYEMLCAKLPFDGTGAEVARANLLLDPPPISQRVPYLEVDPLLEAFARRLMQKKREQRPPTARAARELLDLIDKEPEKAAELLGVSLAARVPQVTQPVAQQAVEDSQDLPVTRAPITRAPTPAPVVEQRATPTAMTDPLEWDQPKRKPGLAIAIGAAVLLALVVVVIALKHTSKPAEPEQTIAMTPTPPATTPTPPPVVAAQPDPAPTEIEMPAETHPVPPVLPKKPIVAKADVPPKPIVETPPLPPAAAPTTEQVNALYATAARDIAAVASKHGNDFASELWKRYRMIQIQDATANPAARAEASATLTKLDQDARAKK